MQPNLTHYTNNINFYSQPVANWNMFVKNILFEHNTLSGSNSVKQGYSTELLQGDP